MAVSLCVSLCPLWLSSANFPGWGHSRQENRCHTFSHEDGVAFARWSITCLLFALAAGVMAFNKMTVCSWMRRKNPAATISIVGGFLGAAGCLMCPFPLLNKAWWLPTMLDMVGAP
jgi:hypothetical protein